MRGKPEKLGFDLSDSIVREASARWADDEEQPLAAAFEHPPQLRTLMVVPFARPLVGRVECFCRYAFGKLVLVTRSEAPVSNHTFIGVNEEVSTLEQSTEVGTQGRNQGGRRRHLPVEHPADGATAEPPAQVMLGPTVQPQTDRVVDRRQARSPRTQANVEACCCSTKMST